ncbi:DeoR/GlpR family DNA-binding transcription regulator [Sediminicola luteus]|uniref:DeoR family transcriptional regulator n=1 Tax=Sediminicola luteus TaxID=319238 RepID=A0A2A4G772_9FLAO|nr:DeoR/GlpR family DNA-binding transcription regulator [Sediminicola luteus]PCE64819.1 DeoR family transcriptional regulator [Sediminicola luteus]
MLKEERHKIILNEVALHNRVLLTDIAEILEVSIDTVRRDVKELDTEGRLRKVHGGAISLGFVNVTSQNQHVYALEEKRMIAKKAVSLLKNGSVILMDGGTTCLEMAKAIPSDLQLTCFTLSLPVAMELLEKAGTQVIFVGGQVSKEAQITVGAHVMHHLSEINVDYSFIGTGYVDPNFGLTEFDWEIVQIKKAVLAASRNTVLLSISEKINSQHRYKTCDISAISTMVTELAPTDPKLDLFRTKNIELL